MVEIELSVMEYELDIEQELRRLLDRFEAEHHIRVKLHTLTWANAWSDLVNFGLYNRGPDVSEIGSTWLGSLVGMDALRPYPLQDRVESAMFLPSVWQGGSLHGDTILWGIPWCADTRILYYRRDLLENAGVDPQYAFQNAAALEQTLSRLPLDNEATPWAVPTQWTFKTLHNIAPWIWGTGGDFVDPSTKKVLFNLPAARAGMCDYFNLIRYIAPQARGASDTQADQFFYNNQAAVVLSGPWMYLGPNVPRASERIEAALPPGVPFVGGTNLVIWQHAKDQRERAAVALVRFLTSQSAQASYCRATGRLPVRLDVLEDPYFAEHPIYRVITQALKQGRSLPALSTWAAIEDKIVQTLGDIWRDLLADPAADVETVIGRNIDPVVRRLEIILQHGSGA